jgi:hypothetical protein
VIIPYFLELHMCLCSMCCINVSVSVADVGASIAENSRNAGKGRQTSHNIKITTTHIKSTIDKSAQCNGFLKKVCCLRMAL